LAGERVGWLFVTSTIGTIFDEGLLFIDDLGGIEEACFCVGVELLLFVVLRVFGL